ncbi:His Kinase A (phospho-acceptor) domain-containing protein [Amycolatopsis xylanica]|uniref:histidine kinase n=1 Tax=Amycolatopsis xylanica TaxID=589385 RepID=A0A1H2SWH8_9PSEU|nr:HAMP domain-containing sensor histidine kinase [Amycolatopsis xylanica]SDW35981.1 His Kinase A (phospho-acceptor) domain-containing protein [Amycolatopsis xylanica]
MAGKAFRERVGTVRVRLTVLVVLVAGLGLLAGGAVVVTLVRQSLTATAEDQATQRAHDVAASPGLPGIPRGPALVQVVLGGRVLASSPELAGRPPLLTGPVARPVVLMDPGISEDHDYTVAGVAAGEFTVYAASSLDPAAEAVDATTTALSIAAPVLFALLAWLTWMLVGRSMAREREAKARQDRFVADAAHELRSPVASMLTRLEVGLAHPDRTDWVSLARDTHREAARLGEVTGDLLALSAVDGRPVDVDLDELVLAEVEALRARGRVSVELSPFEALRLKGNPGELRRVVRNLLDNAERHAAARVVVGLSLAEGWALLAVSDDGAGIPVEERERVFDRFYRLQPARDRDSGGAGLGLAIVREVAVAHGGEAWVAGASEVRVRLPRS